LFYSQAIRAFAALIIHSGCDAVAQKLLHGRGKRMNTKKTWKNFAAALTLASPMLLWRVPFDISGVPAASKSSELQHG
jgi:hypothetical protein